MLPSVPLLHLEPDDAAQNQELDYVNRMCARDIDAVRSMRQHWNTYLDDNLLGATAPPRRLLNLRDAGVRLIRIPLGYWTFEPPVADDCASLQQQQQQQQQQQKPSSSSSSLAPPPPPFPLSVPLEADAPINATTFDRAGLTAEGFATGSLPYLRRALRWIKHLGMRAVLDMHSLPSGAARRVGYSGRYFAEAHAFDGADVWHRADAELSSLPPAELRNLRHTVVVLLRLAHFVRALEDDPATLGVVAGLAPWNEALFSDDLKAGALLPPFTLSLVPRLRAILPAYRYQIYLNFFNQGRDWPAWMADQADALGPEVLAELHLYHAFDPPGLTRCPMCATGDAALASLICQTCGPDAELLRAYRDAGVRTIVGEWSVANCGMWGAHPATVSDADFLYGWFASARSTFGANGVEADFFWNAVIRTDRYDPTVYAEAGRGSRAAVLAEAREAARQPGAAWDNVRAYSAAVSEALPPSYLANWNLLELAATNTSAGHPVALSTAAATAPLTMSSGCVFEPQPAPRLVAAGLMDGSSGSCSICVVELTHVLDNPWAVVLAAVLCVFVGVAIRWCIACSRRANARSARTSSFLQPLLQPSRERVQSRAKSIGDMLGLTSGPP